MATGADYEKRIRPLGKAGLLKLWTQIKSGKTPGWDAGKALEYLVIRAFEIEKASVTYPYEVKEGGRTLEQIDGVVYAYQLACLFECKDHDRPVDHDPIANLRELLRRRPPAAIGSCASVSGFTPNAKQLAVRTAPQNIVLWEGEELEYGLANGKMVAGLMVKYHYCIERAMPDLNIKAAKI